EKVTITDGDNHHLSVKLSEAALQFKEVEIVAERDEPEYAPKVAQIETTPKELSKLPQLAEPDLFRSLQIIPGILPSSDFSAELNIWGGTGDQNLILLNGINVYKPTHLGGLFSIFNMDAVKDVKLIKGGFGAKYGGRLSAVVDVADREGNRYEKHAKVGMSLLSSNATLEGPLPKGSWLVAGRRTYVDAATKLFKDAGIIDQDFPYYFYDFNAKLTRDFPNGDRLSPSVYIGDDKLKISSTTGDRLRLGWGNTTFSIPFVHIFSPKLYSHTTFAGSFFRAKMRFETANSWFNWDNEINDYTGETDLTWYPNARNTVEFGVEGKYLDSYLEGVSETWVFGRNTYDGAIISAYLTDDFRATESWTLSPGVRVERNTIQKVNEVTPRLAIRKDIAPGAHISAAGGTYTQYLQLFRLGEGFASLFDSYIPLSDRFSTNRGTQFALSFQHDSLSSFKVSANAYYKTFENIGEFDFTIPDDGDQDLEDFIRTGKGYAYGMDFSLQGNWGAYQFTWGYGLGRTRRIFEEFDGGLSYPTFFDRLHNTNLFFSRKVRNRGSLECRMNYATGQPYTLPVGHYSPGLELPPHFYIPGRRLGERFEAYTRIDVAYRLRYEWKRWTFSPFFELINLLGTKNPLAISDDISENPPKLDISGQLPFLPSLGFTAEF
ncbi:TonB-dependent receptor, partial [bacterium]|nr:TonB-dependent receptor [bacterium]